MRTDSETVKNIIDTSLENDAIVPFIELASRMVDDKLTGQGMSDDKLKDIETWLTAHLIAITKERQARSEKVGDITFEFTDIESTGLRSTTYGQMAVMLDDSGALEKASKKRAYIKSIAQYPDE